ncbi:MAG: 30S ribosomal protein S3 [Candidatus Phytoplasma pruni]|uniref:30S ribosomal protein S3 n=1 Tax=Poinsettia branch-inducing phytoplasma TaxID=138647 RepID=UPI0003648EAB|nr:30S ribosomal protein S3 [Poinsettia branch-inducing phytoplasma]WEK82378.1 MAG: 30S ribosomal protein S3 [Candidatus Phytoplasma pruni]
MGQKSSPTGLRLGIIRNWDSKWHAEDKQVPNLILEDYQIRNLINNHYPKATISRIEIQRFKKSNKEQIQIFLYTSKSGIVVGHENKEKNKLVEKIKKLIKKDIILNVLEIKNPDKVAILVAQNLAIQLEQRAFFRAAQKMTVQKVLKTGVKGVKIIISGRLGGAEIARQETLSKGLVPLHTLRADIDYSFEEAHTTYGVLGVKVWIYHGEVLPKQTIEDTRKLLVSQHDEKRFNPQDRKPKFDDRRSKFSDRKPKFENKKPFLKKVNNTKNVKTKITS